MEENVLKRILPHSEEAEQSVIGSMIMDREAIVAASELVTGEDFYNRQYGVVFETMVELNDQGSPVDVVTLQNRLKEKDVPPEVSSLEFVRELVTVVPTSANIRYYANIVAEKSLLRKLIRLNEEIANTCYAGKESLEYILEDTEKRVFQLVQKRTTDAYVPIRQVVMNAMDKKEEPHLFSDELSVEYHPADAVEAVEEMAEKAAGAAEDAAEKVADGLEEAAEKAAEVVEKAADAAEKAIEE